MWIHVNSRENSRTEHKSKHSSFPEKSIHVSTPTLKHIRYMSTAPLTHSACTLAGPGAGGTQHQASKRLGTVPRRKVGHGAAAPGWSSSLPQPTDTFSQVSLFPEAQTSHLLHTSTYSGYKHIEYYQVTRRQSPDLSSREEGDVWLQ